MIGTTLKDKGFRLYRKYHNGYAVLCKCPKCETTHLVNHQHRPLVMPRIFCDNCKSWRYEGNTEGEGYVGRSKKSGQKKMSP